MIRGHRRDELPAIARLDEEVFGPDAWGLAAWQDLLAGTGRRAWVATDEDGTLRGYALSAAVGDFAELLRIAVHPDVRRRGLAAALLAAVLAAARGDGADRVLLEVSEENAAALAFYRRHGFAGIDRRPRYYRDDSAALVMVRTCGRMDP